MSKIIKIYLDELRAVLAGCDPAMIQDALADAEEHLRTALEQALEEDPGITAGEALKSIIEKYGTPEEIGAAYRELEERIKPALATAPRRKTSSPASRFFGVLIDPRTYASLLYMIFSLATGIFYFTWAIVGLSLSLSLLVMIIGIPFLGVFLLSVQGIALVEGRLVEALLGVRMPRRPIFSRKDLSVWQRFKALFTKAETWKTIVYMILMLPLGILYFDIVIIMISLSLWGILRPLLEYGFDLPYAQFGAIGYYTPDWMMPLAIIFGIFCMFVTMHMVRGLGRLHGKIARAMLIRD